MPGSQPCKSTAGTHPRRDACGFRARGPVPLDPDRQPNAPMPVQQGQTEHPIRALQFSRASDPAQTSARPHPVLLRRRDHRPPKQHPAQSTARPVSIFRRQSDRSKECPAPQKLWPRHGGHLAQQKSYTGSPTTNRAPRGSDVISASVGRIFSAQITPPCASTICFEIANPSPELLPK